jgi:prophage antirepressor-like protein
MRSIIYKDTPYATLPTVDESQNWKPGTAKSFFYGHQNEFRSKIDYIELTFSEWQKVGNGSFVEAGAVRGKIALLTESGVKKLAELVKPLKQEEEPPSVEEPVSGTLAVFQFHGEPVRTIQDEQDETWWVAKEICKILGITNHRDAIGRLDDDERGSVKVDTLGGPQLVSSVNESGLYKLILRSNKPRAKEFQRWVTHEVLPQIRRKGHYGHETPEFANMAQALTSLATAVSRQTEILTTLVDRRAPRQRTEFEPPELSLLKLPSQTDIEESEFVDRRPLLNREQRPRNLGKNNPLYFKMKGRFGTVVNLWKRRLVGKASFETARRAIYEGRTNITPAYLYVICEALGFSREETKEIMNTYGYTEFVRMIGE